MNWKLITLLSLFGLAMAFATISFVPTRIEPFIWLVIFIIVAGLIGKYAPGKYFLHGFMVSIFNSVWITVIHLIFYDAYIASHPELVEANPMYTSSPWTMAVTGPIIGVVSGLIQGLLAMIAAKTMK